jgi:hypothetical protein
MRRLILAASAALALSIPVGAAVIVPSAPAWAASSISCTGLKGTISGNITITKCLPKGGKAFASASAPASSLESGGTLTWKPYKGSDNTTTVSLSVTSPGQGGCKKGYDEFDATGTVTAEGGTTVGVGIPQVGDDVAARACVDTTNGKIALVAHTSFTL